MLRALSFALVALAVSTPVHAQSYASVTVPYVQFQNEPQLPPIAFQQGRKEESGKVAAGGILKAKVAYPDTYHGFDDGTKVRVDHGWREGQNPQAFAKARAAIAAVLGR